MLRGLLGLLLIAILLSGSPTPGSIVESAHALAVYEAASDRVSSTPDIILDDSVAPPLQYSHRLIVELTSPSLSKRFQAGPGKAGDGQRLEVSAAAAQAYINQVKAEQAAAVSAMQMRVPGATVATYLNKVGATVEAAYHIAFNGFAVDPGPHDVERARQELMRIPGVKAVHRDYAYAPQMYASLPLINAAAVWNNPAIGGMAHAGAGVKIASMDGGIHHDAPMFSGTDFSFPPGYPLGDTANTNGKIIVSRAYFRPWDPPATGDENTWPGEHGTSHGVHTASIAAGNVVSATYLGVTETVGGVAPRAWVMSYRVFYQSVRGIGSFYTVEGLAALEDIIRDGADVVNNSWGAGPSSLGGEFDVLDQALRNAWNAGIFVTMSAGNNGPSTATTDHPSDDYIVVAATSTSGTYAAGRINVSAPQPVPPALKGLASASATFGEQLTPTRLFTYTYTAAQLVNPGNSMGCTPWPQGSLTGKAVVISRGTCEFGRKALNAQNGGAALVIVHNNAAGGDTLITMGPGQVGHLVTIPALFVGYNSGRALIDWAATHVDTAELVADMSAYQISNIPDRVASFSSRGPGVGNVLKPDIAAPGENILAQGYAPAMTGEARHLGYGQSSGTSMAAPHVAGAAALLRQIHPSWSNADIKSALMSTARYLEIYNRDNTPAQPLDIGAGRLDLTRAADPGVLLNPPSLGYGLVPTGTVKVISVTVTSVATTTQTFTLSTLFTGNGFTETTSLPGFSISPSSLTLAPGAGATFTVTFTAATGSGLGDNQGYVLLNSADYEAHLPAWARVTHSAPLADILIVDSDLSPLSGFTNYARYYTETIEALGYTYTVLDLATMVGSATNFLHTVDLTGYRAVILFTGDHDFPNGAVTEPTPFTEQDLYSLNAYAQSGGTVIAMGQSLSSVLNSDVTNGGQFFYRFTLGGNWLQYDVAKGGSISPTFIISSTDALPFAGITLDLGEAGNGAGNQRFVDEIESARYITITTPSSVVDEDYAGVLHHRRSDNVDRGVVAMVHRGQPTLERRGVTFGGRTLYTAFGLEGVNNDTGYTTREQFLRRALDWAWDTPTVSITTSGSGLTRSFTATVASDIDGVSGVSYRWDFGDGSPYAGPIGSNAVEHTYAAGGTYTVTVEATNSLGNKTVYSHQFEIGSFGVAVTPSTALASGTAGEIVTYTLQVTNTGGLTDTFDVALTGNTWPTISPSSVGPLGSGDSAMFEIGVSIPSLGAFQDRSDTVTVTITSQGDSAVSTVAAITTESTVRRIHLPIVVSDAALTRRGGW